MRFKIILSALVASVIAAPTASLSPAQELSKRITESDLCALPVPKPNCAGATTQDVIVQYGKNFTQEQKDLFLNAAKSSGAEIVHDLPNFGFAGIIPQSVVSLIKAHGKSLDLKVTDNACAGIPWCGEAPC